MLELLFAAEGTTLTKEMFLNHLYGGMDEPELKIIDVFICKLRKKKSSPRATEGRTTTSRRSGPGLRAAATPEPEGLRPAGGRVRLRPRCREGPPPGG